MERVLLRLRELSQKPELVRLLAYPTMDEAYSEKILEELGELEVEGVYFTAKPRLEPLRIGKGYRGVVLLARRLGEDVALKILRADAGISTLRREAELTSAANRAGVGPCLLGSAEHVLALEYIIGEDLDLWLGKADYSLRDIVRLVLRRCLEQARRLDEIGLDHGELSNARRHILVKENLSPVILDFGKASFSRKPHNVTSLFSYITYGPHSSKILEILDVSEKPLEVVREYKREGSRESFEKILKALNLE